MRRTWRKRLRLLGLFGLLVVALGAAAVAGWLPPINHWVERRLLDELRVLGVETSATHLRELSWRRAVAGPVELQLPGLTVRAEEARAELGWKVLAGRAAPAVVLRGLRLEVAMDRLTELRGALQAQSGGFPYGRLEVEDSRVVLQQGERRLELPFSGFIDSRVEELRAEVLVTAPALAGRLKVRTDLGEDLVELEVSGGRIAPSPWRELLADLAPPALRALETATDGSIQISGTAAFAAGQLRSAMAEASLPALVWRPEGQQADLAAVNLQLGAGSDGRWRLEARTAAAAWQRGENVVGLTDLDVVIEPGAAQLNFGDARVVAAGFELQLQGRAEARWVNALAAATAEAHLKIASAGRAGVSLAAPCELALRWNGADLALAAPALELTQPYPVQLQAVEATVSGLRTEHPSMMARAQAATAPLIAFAVPGLSMQPAQVAAQLSITAGLARGEEGLRVEWTVPQQRRNFAWTGGKAEVAVGGEGILNLDRSYCSGRAAFELRDLSTSGEDWSATVPTATFTVRWPRLWLDAVRGWSGLSGERLVRELAWAGDYTVKVAGGSGRVGRDVRLAEIELHASSRGAELSETGGADFGASVGEIAVGELRLRDGKLEATFGLEGGVVQGSCALPDLTLQPTFAQLVHWGDGLAAEGTFGFAPTVLTGEEPWGRWWPALAAFRFTGGVEFQGRSSYSRGLWTTGADLRLKDLSVAWPARKISVERINGAFALPDLSALRSAPDQRLTVAQIDFAGVEFANTAVAFALDGPARIAVTKIETEAFGGRLAVDAFDFDPRRPEPAVRLQLAGAQLEQLLALFDDVPAQAEGAVDGDLPLTWTDGRLSLGTGSFRLAQGEVGRVRFTQYLHLFADEPSWFGIGQNSKKLVEQSVQDLRFDRMHIDIHPQDSPGQSLRIRLVGAPTGGEFSTAVNLDINVNAPLEHFLNWGINRAR